VPGFKGRSGRTFRAKLKIERDDAGKWRVEFDEAWAKEPPPEAQTEDGPSDGGPAPAPAAAEAPAAG
jgi:DNA topoisomerase-3